jgi:hypothetical protein
MEDADKVTAKVSNEVFGLFAGGFRRGRVRESLRGGKGKP